MRRRSIETTFFNKIHDEDTKILKERNRLCGQEDKRLRKMYNQGHIINRQEINISNIMSAVRTAEFLKDTLQTYQLIPGSDLNLAKYRRITAFRPHED